MSCNHLKARVYKWTKSDFSVWMVVIQGEIIIPFPTWDEAIAFATKRVMVLRQELEIV